MGFTSCTPDATAPQRVRCSSSPKLPSEFRCKRPCRRTSALPPLPPALASNSLAASDVAHFWHLAPALGCEDEPIRVYRHTRTHNCRRHRLTLRMSAARAHARTWYFISHVALDAVVRWHWLALPIASETVESAKAPARRCHRTTTLREAILKTRHCWLMDPGCQQLAISTT